jgi:mitochondrial inner membrane protease subunit 1
VSVRGVSMRPTLDPGDRLLAIRGLALHPGDLALVRDPRRPDRTMVKRVTAVGEDSSIEVLGDNAPASTDSRHFGPVPADLVVGRVVYRYLPAHRAGAMLGR